MNKIQQIVLDTPNIIESTYSIITDFYFFILSSDDQRYVKWTMASRPWVDLLENYWRWWNYICINYFTIVFFVENFSGRKWILFRSIRIAEGKIKGQKISKSFHRNMANHNTIFWASFPSYFHWCDLFLYQFWQFI